MADYNLERGAELPEASDHRLCTRVTLNQRCVFIFSWNVLKDEL